ncbi:MAG: FtsW/RodA/SpoVE family cell cycle protein, partial [Oscillospiraceae bacterium]|nr:FtsW/RodA/SpoVE family cell cycle protein [Oscillospiraceae bacterium]
MSSVFRKVRDYLHRTNKLLWLIAFSISVFSLILLKSAERAYNGSYFKTQLVAILLGYACAFIITLIDYRTFANFWYLIAGFCIFLMIYTLLFADAVQSSGGVNARAWITIGGRSFQPSELVKIGFMVTFAKHVEVLKRYDRLKSFLQVAFLGVHALVPVVLCHLQGDDGAAMIFFCMFLAMSFGAGVQARYFLGVLAAIVILVPLAWKFDLLAEYQKIRFTAMFHLDDPNFDPDIIYQQVQGRTSIGSGQLWGRGLFQGPRVSDASVPFQHSDYIFSVAGEELGFIGCCAIIGLIFALLITVLFCAKRARDDCGACICYGFFGLVASQTIINLGM